MLCLLRLFLLQPLLLPRLRVSPVPLLLVLPLYLLLLLFLLLLLLPPRLRL